MEKSITNISDVQAYFSHLVALGLSFHPDDSFEDYVILGTEKPFFSTLEAQEHNRLMALCFEVCKKENVDIYEIGMQTFC